MIEDQKIPKIKTKVRIVLKGSEVPDDGYMYLAPNQRLLDYLNESNDFIPFTDADSGTTLCIPRRNISVAGEIEEEEEDDELETTHY